MYEEKVIKFKKYVYDNIDFFAAYSIFTKEQNKQKCDGVKGNIVGCINSAMDWMGLAAQALDELKDESIYNSLDVFNLIAYNHIIFESITDLNKVLLNTGKSTPFYKHSEIFKDYPFKFWDNDYLNNIRAAFGEHGTDLIFKDKLNNSKYYYSSWPIIDKYKVKEGLVYDCYTFLYNEDDEMKYEVFGFKYEDLYLFANRNINYLDELVRIIEKYKTEHINRMKNITIVLEEDVHTNIKKVINENKMRLNNDYYDSCLDYIDILFNCSYRDEKINDYMNEYKNQVYKQFLYIKDNIQNMIVQNIEDGLFDFHCDDPNVNKEFADINNNVYSSYKPVFMDVIYRYLKDVYDIEKEQCLGMNYKELYCFLIAISNK